MAEEAMGHDSSLGQFGKVLPKNLREANLIRDQPHDREINEVIVSAAPSTVSFLDAHPNTLLKCFTVSSGNGNADSSRGNPQLYEAIANN
jgi:hypothetical protein